MTHLFESLTWTLDQHAPGSTDFVIYGDGGARLASTTRVPTRRPNDDPSVPYANPHAQFEPDRMVLCVAAPDGSPHFYMDYTDRHGAPMQVFVVAPDGTPIGSVGLNVNRGQGRLRIFKKEITSTYELRDPHGQILATMSVSVSGLGRAALPAEQEQRIINTGGTEVARAEAGTKPNAQGNRPVIVRFSGLPPQPLPHLTLATFVGPTMMATLRIAQMGHLGR